MKVLYIEDEPSAIRLVELYIQSISQEISIATNLSDAYMALDSQPDLILVDIMLEQRHSGIEFTRRLRGQGYRVPMVAVTALSTPKDIEACYEAGVNQVLVKPFTISQLAEALSEFMS